MMVQQLSERSSERSSRAKLAISNGPCPQPKLTINQPNDRYEQEADRVADQVMRMPQPTLQRKCACGGTCSKCKGAHNAAAHDQLQLKQMNGPAPGHREVPSAVHDVVQQPGRPLDAPTRGFMEPRFGHDLSHIRIHTDRPAAASAEAVQAKAYTVGDHIVFGGGHAPQGTSAGMGLLAHELTHTVQQGGTPRALQRTGEEGSSRFRETAQPQVRGADGVVRGSVRREEYVPATATQAEVSLNDQTVPVEFDESTCTVSLRHTYAFVAGRSSAVGICGGPSAGGTPVSAARLAEIQRSYLQAVNEGLSGWYVARMDGEHCTTCAGRDIPIQVVATAATGGAADTTITVVNSDGRADAATICAGSHSGSTNVHEGGHQVLGVGDEYPEEDAATLARVPVWGRRERVRSSDWSRMGPSTHSRFALLHQRHFAHVTAFLQQAYPVCPARLVEMARPIIPDLRFTLQGGYASLDGAHSLFAQVGLDVGIPLTRLREWELVVGARGSAYLPGDSSGLRAWMVGARAGLEYTSSPSDGGLTLGTGLTGGYGEFDTGGRGRTGVPFGEVDLHVGYQLSPDFPLSLGLDLGAGTSLTALPGASGLPSDERTRQWFRAGFLMGGRF
jgi:Domain of unknown function (DUF4157)